MNDMDMERAWNQTRVSLKFAFEFGCFAPKENRIPYNDNELRNVAYGECMESVRKELNVRPTQHNQVAMANGKVLKGTVHEVEQVGLMLTGKMDVGNITYTVMRCLEDDQWEVTIGRNNW